MPNESMVNPSEKIFLDYYLAETNLICCYPLATQVTLDFYPIYDAPDSEPSTF